MGLGWLWYVNPYCCFHRNRRDVRGYSIRKDKVYLFVYLNSWLIDCIEDMLLEAATLELFLFFFFFRSLEATAMLGGGGWFSFFGEQRIKSTRKFRL